MEIRHLSLLRFPGNEQRIRSLVTSFATNTFWTKILAIFSMSWLYKPILPSVVDSKQFKVPVQSSSMLKIQEPRALLIPSRQFS